MNSNNTSHLIAYQCPSFSETNGNQSLTSERSTQPKWHKQKPNNTHHNNSIKASNKPLQTSNTSSKSTNTHHYLNLLLLRAGYIETNPGPSSPKDNATGLSPAPFLFPPTQILLQPDTNINFNVPDIPIHDIPKFDFLEFYTTPHGRELVRQRCYNILFSCPSCKSLNNCLNKFSKFHVKSAIPLSRMMVNTITECLTCYRCAVCLHYSNRFQTEFLPQGFTCSQECATYYMDNFIMPFNYSEHRSRANWIKHLGLRSMNNIGRTPSCKKHYSYKICLMDSMDLNQIQTWITSTDNSTKKRKQRAKKRHIPQLNLDTIINLIYNIAGGASCSGTNCLKSMWLLQGETEFDSSLDLHYCSTSCLNSRKKVKRTNNMHQDRINIIKLCLQEKYHLTDSPLHKPNTLAGAPLFKQIYETTNKQH